MPLISKTFPSPYGGISEQSVELMLDQQCIDMVNCVPDVVLGCQRRNPTAYVAKGSSGLSQKVFHFYDRGEGDERYFFSLTGNSSNPISIYDINGIVKTVSYATPAATIFAYVDTTISPIKGMTLQDRTFILNKSKVIGLSTVTAPDINYDKYAYYWLSRSSNDTNNKYNYAVYLDGITFQFSHEKSDAAATGLAALIEAHANFTATAIGSIIKISKTSLADFTFSYWDSWGSQASYGWKGRAAKISDLPSEMSFPNVIVTLTGDDNNDFTDYYVKHDGSTWVETINPLDTRGTFTNMPIYVDRLSDGTFSVSSITWELPHIGDTITNSTPSFVNNKINDIFFYKNRLGFASGVNIILSETGGYYNFYSKTVLSVIDSDPIDVAIPSNEASNIYYAVPFQAGLFSFTKEAQYVLKNDSGTFSPLTVTFDLISKLPIDTDVEPVNASNSLFFISKTGTSASQLREYKYNNNTLVADGINLSIQTPNLLPDINKIAVDINLGYVFCYSPSTPTTIYCYKYLSQGEERVQSAFFKWTFNFNIINLFVNRSTLLLFKTSITNDYLLSMPLLINNNTKLDITTDVDTGASYSSYFVLPRWNIKVTKMETPVDTIIVKRLTFIGEGTYNVDIYRKDYGTTTSRTYSSNSTVDGSASVLAKNKNVVITLKNNGDENFRLDSMILDGLYTQTTRETN